MIYLVAAVAFVAGWWGSWRFGGWLYRTALRQPHTRVTSSVVAQLPQETLLALGGVVQREIEKRRR